MPDRNAHILASPGFLVGLSLLLTNDFVFKHQFHNAFTGKLSDFAGLFVFSLFWMAFFPRHKNLISVSTAVLFVFWKSAYSQFAIDGWNSLPFVDIQRTVDYSDLWALLIVPLSYYYSNISAGFHVSPRFIYAVAIVSLVAFTATQFSYKESFQNQYQFQLSRKQLLQRMSRLPRSAVDDSFWEADTFQITFDSCYGRANISLEARDNQSVITLNEMEFRCPSQPTPDEMREQFEKEFIDKLREEPVTQSLVLSIWSSAPPSPSTPSP